MDTNLIEEYKTLRDEIGRAQENIVKISQFGLTVSAALFTLAYSTVISPSTRWLVLFIPWFVLLPLVIHQSQLFVGVFKIARYIQVYLEPKLGLHWHAASFYFDLSSRSSDLKTRVFFWWGPLTPYMALLAIQLLCPIVSFLENPTNLIIWMILSSVIVLSVIFQSIMIMRALPREKILQRMENTISSTLEQK